MSGRPFFCREEDEGAVAEAAWRRRRWGELSIAAAAGGGLVGLVCYQLYGDPRADPSELVAPELEESPRGRGLLPIPVAAAKETVSAWARARTAGGWVVRCPTCPGREGWREGVTVTLD